MATASPETAKNAMEIIVGSKEEQARHDTTFETFASKVFQMQNDENYQSHLLEEN